MRYEFHYYKDPELKILFHKDTRRPKLRRFPHCHLNPELLLIIEGELTVNMDSQPHHFRPGELAIVGRNVLHSFENEHPCTYYCLIIDDSLCSGIDRLPTRCNDPKILSIYNDIVSEMEQMQFNYREVVTGLSKTLLALLSRQSGQQQANDPLRPKIELTRRAIEYIYEHFQEELSLEEISAAMNVSKHYLSHVFKEVTRKTVVEMVHYVRCKNASSLIVSGKYTVAEAAFASGFNHLSYFSKVYKRTMGRSPSEDLKNKN